MDARRSPAARLSVTEMAEAGDLAKRMDLFTVETPRRRLEHLIIPAEAMTQIRSILAKIRHHKILYEDFGLNEVDPTGGRTAINFFGPPGTGKSFAAETIAAELGVGFIRANYAEIESKFVGETPKNIRAAFFKAEKAEALLFFDEADSILGKRLSNVSQSTDHAVNLSRSVMLMQLDVFTGVVVFATNLLSNYDPAFMRRILGHIELPLPDARSRARLWRRYIPRQMPVELSRTDWNQLVAISEGMAGGDILNAVLSSAAAVVAREGVKCRIKLDDFADSIRVAKTVKEVAGAKN